MSSLLYNGPEVGKECPTWYTTCHGTDVIEHEHLVWCYIEWKHSAPRIVIKSMWLLLQQISRILEESRFDIESDASLSRACSLELKDHCGDIPKGDGLSMASCLLTIVITVSLLSIKGCQSWGHVVARGSCRGWGFGGQESKGRAPVEGLGTVKLKHFAK